ncbi:hypothetical protein BCR21_13420 [Enterococcus ureasiticus]|uniref:Uncharacterized protein n=1 Tax=Enterococcus ureasiticus TaxID=903984 RepID=A0A1E5GC93_9ENTE|nr:hypothetical protein BCR21_13420 [Enterococcus ureasiticus]
MQRKSRASIEKKIILSIHNNKNEVGEAISNSVTFSCLLNLTELDKFILIVVFILFRIKPVIITIRFTLPVIVVIIIV